MALQRLEVLVYQHDFIDQPVYDENFQIIWRIKNNEIVVVVGDENKPYIKVMTGNCMIGWTYFNRRFLNTDLVEIQREL